MTQDTKAEALRIARDLKVERAMRNNGCAEKPMHEAEQMLIAQHARIAELEAQLSAVGAGGVEPLRKCLHQIAEPAHPTRQGLDAQLAATQPVFSHMELRAYGNLGAGRAVAVDTMGREMPGYNPLAAVQQGVQPGIEHLPRYTYGYQMGEDGSRSLSHYTSAEGQFLKRDHVLAALAAQAKQGGV